MNKLIFGLIFFFCINFNVNAKEIIINDTLYNTNSDIYGKGYYFDNSANTLYLDDYYGGSITFDGELIIFLRDNNVIDNNGKEISIKANNLTIHGNGKLYIINTQKGIYSENLAIDRTEIYINADNLGIENYGQEIMLYEVKLKIEAKEIGILGNQIMNINGSIVNIIGGNIGINSINKMDIYSFNDDIYIDSHNYCLYNINKLDLEETRLYLKSQNLCLQDKIVNENENNQVYVSMENNNYIIDREYYNYSNVKIANINDIDELLINDSNLIFEVDNSIFDYELNEKVETKSEYTQIENDQDKEIVIDNPNTYDDIKKTIIWGIVSLVFLGILSIAFRRNNARS